MAVTLATMVPAGRDIWRADWLAECLGSAAGQGEHVVFDTDDFFAGRRQLYTMGGTVACLDWDDRVLGGATDACEAAMGDARAGLAFTWQRRIDTEGAALGEDLGPVTRLFASSEPNSIHHLVCLRSDLVPHALLDVIERVAPLCVDWIVKAYVALRYGAVQVPMIGYEWRQHESQESRVKWSEYSKQVPLARALIRTWLPSGVSQCEHFPVWGGLQQ